MHLKGRTCHCICLDKLGGVTLLGFVYKPEQFNYFQTALRFFLFVCLFFYFLSASDLYTLSVYGCCEGMIYTIGESSLVFSIKSTSFPAFCNLCFVFLKIFSAYFISLRSAFSINITMLVGGRAWLRNLTFAEGDVQTPWKFSSWKWCSLIYPSVDRHNKQTKGHICTLKGSLSANSYQKCLWAALETDFGAGFLLVWVWWTRLSRIAEWLKPPQTH